MLFNGKALVICTRRFRFHGYGFHELLSLSGFSSKATPAPTHFLVKYLVDSLGFSREKAISTSAKVSYLKTSKNFDLALNFFEQIGLDKPQMKKMISGAPKLLFCDVSKTLKPKFKCLIELGLSGPDLVNVIVKDPTIMERGVDTHLKPMIDCLRRILGSDEHVLNAVKKSRWLFSFGSHKTVETNASLMRNHGLSDVQINKLVLKNPRCISLKPECLKDLLHRVEKDFGIPRESPMFLHGLKALGFQKKSTLEMKIGIFKSFGWSDDDILVMFRGQPSCMTHSEAKIKKTLMFYMKDLGYEPAYMASHPAMLAYSLEKRVVPRMQVLKILDDNKLPRRKCALYTVLTLTESKFIEDFVLPYKDQIPDLYKSFIESVCPE